MISSTCICICLARSVDARCSHVPGTCVKDLPIADCKELYTYAKIDHISIKVNFINCEYTTVIISSLFPQELYTFAKITHVSVPMNFMHYAQLYVI